MPALLPRIACCNFIPQVKELQTFARQHGFEGVDWSLTPENLPGSLREETELVRAIRKLHPLEVRYHGTFPQTDLGDADPEAAQRAMAVFRRICLLVAKLDGRVLTIHVGLGRNSTLGLSWKTTLAGLGDLVRFAGNLGVRLCLENLAWGWTSRPELYEKLIRKSGVWGTFDIGHARVSPSIKSHHFQLEDFLSPHPDRFLNAHIYHKENESGHLAPREPKDLEDRLRLLQTLPSCDWWVLELREEQALLQTLRVVKDFLASPAVRGVRKKKATLGKNQ